MREKKQAALRFQNYNNEEWQLIVLLYMELPLGVGIDDVQGVKRKMDNDLIERSM